MGVTTWRRPLPRTATREEMLADLRDLAAEIRRVRRMNALVMLFGWVAGLALILMAVPLGW